MRGGLALAEAGRANLPGPAPEAPRGDLFVTLPNLITVARLCAVPATVWLILHGRLDWGFGLFVAAGISDAVDGWLARIRHARSVLGAVLDPLADKTLLVSVYVTLAAVGVLPDWLAILVVFRDMIIIGGFLMLWVVGQEPVVRPIFISKLNTTLQIGLAALALGLACFGHSAPLLLDCAIVATAASTLASGGAYVWGALTRGAA